MTGVAGMARGQSSPKLDVKFSENSVRNTLTGYNLFQGREDWAVNRGVNRETLSEVENWSICSIAIKRHGLLVDLEPDHPKMGSLISAVAERAPALVRTKRS